MNPNPSQTNSSQSYVPGVCNIGPAEIAKRKQFGWIGVVVTLALWLIGAYLRIPAPWFLVLFFPASMGATGLIQGFSHFCAGFGMKGFFNFGPQAGKVDTVDQAEFRAKDKKKAIAIFTESVLFGILIAMLAFFVN